jgi:NAD(P)-dependent dehydrogenase (short-subunit alcohol dehydrogenase family)
MNDLRGRTALVTGAAGGIGREFVLSLLRARANVLAADVSDAGLERLVKTMERDGFGQCLTSRHLDISDHRACHRLLGKANDLSKLRRMPKTCPC